jgi:hypothetical protein
MVYGNVLKNNLLIRFQCRQSVFSTTAVTEYAKQLGAKLLTVFWLPVTLSLFCWFFQIMALPN